MKTTGKRVFHKSGLGEGQTSESRTIREDLGTQERFPKGKMIKEAGPCPASLVPGLLPLPLAIGRSQAKRSWRLELVQ